MKAFKILSVLAVFFVVASAHASVSGSLGFDTPTLVRADAAPTGNINTATMFDLQGLTSTENENGIFAGLPVQDFGDVMFSPAVSTSFKVSDIPFGFFSSRMITVIHSSPGFLNLLFAGQWIPGAFNPGVNCPALGCPAVFRMGLTQTPISDGAISMSGTMSIVTVVPEPSTFVLFGIGIALLVIGTRLRGWLPS